jgi:hypothetical protein
LWIIFEAAGLFFCRIIKDFSEKPTNFDEIAFIFKPIL